MLTRLLMVLAVSSTWIKNSKFCINSNVLSIFVQCNIKSNSFKDFDQKNFGFECGLSTFRCSLAYKIFWLFQDSTLDAELVLGF